MPLPWPGVPHGNAFAVAAGDGIVLFDTGYADEDGTRQLELALAQVGFGLADVGLLVCTHAHTDHYGLADPIIPPDRDLVPGVEIETDLGIWQVHETPGHAPSHVVLHQPESGLLISGDHVLGRVSPFFDYGHTPDPVGEFLGSLGAVAALDTGLCLAGHGRPFRDVPATAEANRRLVSEHLDRVRKACAEGPRTAFEVAGDIVGAENLTPATAAWGLQMALAYVDHLVIAGGLVELEGSDPRRWQLA